MKVGIINITGYAGAELARILHRHPEVDISSVTGRSGAGKALGDVFPHLSDINIQIDPELTGSLDFVFSALPHAASAEALSEVIAADVKAVDISADFRLRDLETYTEWYGVEHPCPQYLEKSVYGLPEVHREAITKASVVANPGCYPTASILGLLPALRQGIIDNNIIIDAKSGVSGAGRGLSIKTHFSEVNENVSAYGLDGHRHMPEIAQELNLAYGSEVALTFVPHLIPMTRGIFATSYSQLTDEFLSNNSDPAGAIDALYQETYAQEKYVEVTEVPPSTKQTLGSNQCLVYPKLDSRTGRLIVVSCIDNLVKGAAGQAVQNMNILSGYEESTGIDQLAIYP